MSGKYETRDIAATIQRSAVASDARLMRTGLDAAGLTAEYDEAAAKSTAKIMEMFPNEDMKQDFLARTADTDRAARESIRKYEMQQVFAGAEAESAIQLDNMQKGFAEWATLETGRLEKEYADNAERERKIYEAGLEELRRIREHDKAVGQVEALNDAIDSAKDGEEAFRNIEKYDENYDSDWYKKAVKLAKDDYESAMARAKGVYDKGIGAVAARFHSLAQDMHMVHFNTRKAMMDDDATANSLASAETRKRMKGLIGGFTESGYAGLSGVLIEKYSDRFATGVPLEREAKDKDGNALKDDNGNAVMEVVTDEKGNVVYDTAQYNPGGRAWMGMADVAELKKGLDAKVLAMTKAANAKAEAVGADAKAAVNLVEIQFMEEVRKSDPAKAEALLDAYMAELVKHAAANPEAVRQAQGRMISEMESKKKVAEVRKAVYQGAAHRYGGYSADGAIAAFNSTIDGFEMSYAKSVAVRYLDYNGNVAQMGDIDADFVVAAHCDAMLERTDLDGDMRSRIKERRAEALKGKRAKEARGFMSAINAIGFIRKDVQAMSSRTGSVNRLVDTETGIQTGEQVYLGIGDGGEVDVEMGRGEKLTFVYAPDSKSEPVEYTLGKAEAENLFAALYREYELIPSNYDTDKGRKDTERFAKIVKAKLIDGYMKSKASERFNWLAVAESIGGELHESMFKPEEFASESQLRKRMYLGK